MLARQLVFTSDGIARTGGDPVTATQFGIAYTDFFDHTVRFLASKGLPESEAREMAQAAWTRGWERRHQLRDPKMILTWINSIAFNLFRNEFRRSARHSELPDLPDKRTFQSISRIDLKSMLSRCDALDRSLLWMQYGEGRTSAEIAGRIGMNAGTVRIRIMRAKGRLRCKVGSRRAAFPDGTAVSQRGVSQSSLRLTEVALCG